MSYTDEELILYIRNLSDEEKQTLRNLPESYFETWKGDLLENIATEAKSRIQSKIALTFTRGYSTGALLQSIYYTIEGDSIRLSSTKNYFVILNKGYDSYDMKKTMSGRTVKMRLPGGAVVYRRVASEVMNKTVPNLNKRIRRKNYATSNWIHPGWRGVHIYEMVEREMESWIQTYVREQVNRLLMGQSSFASFPQYSDLKPYESNLASEIRQRKFLKQQGISEHAQMKRQTLGFGKGYQLGAFATDKNGFLRWQARDNMGRFIKK